MSFRAPAAAFEQKKLLLLPKYATHPNLITGSTKVYETGPLGYLFKIIERILSSF